MPLEYPNLRTVVVLNKKYEVGRQMSAMGHVILGLAAGAADVKELALQEYRDADGLLYPNISCHPVIVLKASKSGDIRSFRHNLEEAGLPAVTFVDTMFDGGTPVQLEATAGKSSIALEYVAAATFGPGEALRPLTKRFGLLT